MKSRIASALAVLACVGALSACGGKHHAGRDAGTTGTTAVQPAAGSSADPGAPQPSAGSGDPAASDSVSDPDGALSSLDGQLSDLDNALKSADDQPSSVGDGG